jgi:hypothetical protein
MPVPLACPDVEHLFFSPWAVFTSDADGGNLVEATFGWCGACGGLCGARGAVTGLAIAPSTAWAEVTGTRMPCGSDVVVQLKPTDGVTGGDLRVTGSIIGLDQCKNSITCPIDLTYHVVINGSTVSINR